MPPEKPENAKTSASPDESELAKRVRDLENALAATRAGMPLNLIPEHAAGVGGNVHESWSQYDQELALRGEHPDQ